MIAHSVRLADDSARRTDPDVDAAPSIPVLEAALEVGRQDRLWLKQRLFDRKSEADSLREELRAIQQALPEPAAVLGALPEPGAARGGTDGPESTASPAASLKRRLAAVWEERDRLMRLLQEQRGEREELANAVRRAKQAAADARRLAAEATLAADAAGRQRDTLAAELAAALSAAEESRAAAEQNGAAADAPPRRGPDLDELAHAVELVALAVAEVRDRLPAADTHARSALRSVAALEVRLGEALAPLALVPELQAQVAALAARVEQLTARAAPS